MGVSTAFKNVEHKIIPVTQKKIKERIDRISLLL